MKIPKKIRLEHTQSSNCCDFAGCSGGYADGGKIFFDDVEVFNHIPVPTCTGEDGSVDLYEKALELLGISIEEKF